MIRHMFALTCLLKSRRAPYLSWTWSFHPVIETEGGMVVIILRYLCLKHINKIFLLPWCYIPSWCIIIVILLLSHISAHQAAASVCVLFLSASTAVRIVSVIFRSIRVGSEWAQVPFRSGLFLCKLILMKSGMHKPWPGMLTHYCIEATVMAHQLKRFPTHSCNTLLITSQKMQS